MTNLDKLLPQTTPMRFIDRIVRHSNDCIDCQSLITNSHVFFSSHLDGINHWIAIEIMAQSAAALAALIAHSVTQTETSAKPAFLMSVRGYQSFTEHYRVNSLLDIHTQKVFIDGNVGVFDSRISINGKTTAITKITAIEPDERTLTLLQQGSTL